MLTPTDPSHPAAVPTSLRQHASFVRFWCARTSTTGAFQMLSVAVGWQLYDLTNNPLDLGIAGLVQFVPLVALALIVGQVSDRYDRRALIRITQISKALAALALAAGTAGGWLTRVWVFGHRLVIRSVPAFGMANL